MFKNCLYILLLTITFGGLTACKNITPKKSEKHYNILWIVADDLGVDIGAYGNSLIHTPNLDKLASESILYKNLFTSTAVCSPSRSGLITGMYPVTLGVHQHRTRYKKQLPDSIIPIPELFKKAGYFVTNGNGNKNSKKGKTDYNFKVDVNKLYQATHWNKRAKEQSFFSQVQIFYPHRPFKKDTINPIDPDKVIVPPYYANHPIAKKDWALYLETVQHVDQRVGEIISQLKNDNLLENTIIFFFGDQSRPHLRAKQFLYDSGTNTPLLVRYPDGFGAGSISDKLVSNIDIAAATLALAGVEIPHYMQGQNFLSDKIERDYVFTMRDRRDETVDRIRAVRSKKFKYIKNYYPDRPYTQFNAYKEMRYPMLPLMRKLYKEKKLNSVQERFLSDDRPIEELYDLEKDPFETVNLAHNENYKTTLIKMRSVLESWVAINDKGIYPEAQEEIDFAKKRADERFKKNMKERGLLLNVTDEEMIKYWKNRLFKE